MRKVSLTILTILCLLASAIRTASTTEKAMTDIRSGMS